MRPVTPLLLLLLVLQSQGFELQDTIHVLIEENIRLHDQLESLTKALRELKHLLWQHSNDPGHHEHLEHHSAQVQHLWEEWSQHGMSADTHLLLEHAFCGMELHSSAGVLQKAADHLLMMTLCFLAQLTAFCLHT
ncbi:uncharacterized protein ACB058_004067 [Synchiropus picturatus]